MLILRTLICQMDDFNGIDKPWGPRFVDTISSIEMAPLYFGPLIAILAEVGLFL